MDHTIVYELKDESGMKYTMKLSCNSHQPSSNSEVNTIGPVEHTGLTSRVCGYRMSYRVLHQTQGDANPIII